ncbi:MAG: TonB-dependent receptor [Bacteroidaceae bacterium]|nr:TonB-dependent receptor [Bacteroidaceae bacterium]
MKRIHLLIVSVALFGTAYATETNDTLRTGSIQEVVITGTRAATDVRHLSQTVNVIDRTAIEETNRTSLLPLLTEQVPGLFVTQRGYAGYGVSDGAAGTISMRGLTGSGTAVRTLVLIDGHPNYAGIFGHPIADSYQSLMTERVEVLRGPASMLYGSYAMSGVINIVTKKPQDGTHAYLHAGYGSFNTAETEFSVNTQQGKLSAVASGSYNRTDGHRENLNFEQFGGYAKVGYDISKNWNASANVDITRFKASYPGPENDPLTDADQDITRGTSSLFFENNYGRTSGAVSVFYSWGDHWINDGYKTPDSTRVYQNRNDTVPKLFRFTSYDDMMGVSAWQSVNLFEGNRITVGVDYYRYGGKVVYDSIGNRPDSLLIDRREHELAGYIEVRQNIGSWLTLNAGLRADHHFSIGTEFVPQAGAAFHLPANAEVKLSVAKGFRYPTFKDNFLFQPKNPDLEPESLWNYELSFSQTLLSNRLYYGINLFHMDVKNTIQAMPGAGGPKNQNTGELKHSGVEFEASYLISKTIALNGNYSYLKMETPVVGAPKHKAYLGGSCTNNGLHVSTGLQYVNSLYTTVKQPRPATVLANPDITEDFLLWNARVSYQLSDMLQLWVNGDNLLNTKYQINDGYPMPGIAFMAGINLTF